MMRGGVLERVERKDVFVVNDPEDSSPSVDGMGMERKTKHSRNAAYDKVVSGYKTFTANEPFCLKYNNAVLPELTIAYETWGELNVDRTNTVILHAGLSGSSHAKSHESNHDPGWWESFVGAGGAIDTDKFFVICTNTLGSCFGTSGPSSVSSLTGKPYATTFPIISVEDIANAQFCLLDHLGIQFVHASLGASLGGMVSLMAAALYPERVGRIVSISACAQTHSSTIAAHGLQRECIMSDTNWNEGFYYDKELPKTGLKLARELGFLTFRSGFEWDERFGRKMIKKDQSPSLSPTFLIESYLGHKGERFGTQFDPNSMLYLLKRVPIKREGKGKPVSLAIDLFDMSEGFDSMKDGLSRVTCPVMIIGNQTDLLFPIMQQRDLAENLIQSGNTKVSFCEVNSVYGHDAFLLDIEGVGNAVKVCMLTEKSFL